jgi:hypothetical protein
MIVNGQRVPIGNGSLQGSYGAGMPDPFLVLRAMNAGKTPQQMAAETAAAMGTQQAAQAQPQQQGSAPTTQAALNNSYAPRPGVYGGGAPATAAPSSGGGNLWGGGSGAMSLDGGIFAPRVSSMTPTAGTGGGGFGRAGGSGGGSGYGRSGGSGGDDYSAAIARIQQLHDSANQANEERFQQAQDLLKRYGGTATRQAKTAATQAKGEATQQLIDRGLGNSTLRNSAMRGIDTDLQNNLAGIGERKALMQADLLERKTDQGPNLGVYAELLSRPGGATAVANMPTSTGGSGGIRPPQGMTQEQWDAARSGKRRTF